MKKISNLKSFIIVGLFILFNIYANAQTPPNDECGKVINFDNSKNTIRLNTSIQLSGEYTIAGWFKTNAINKTILHISRDIFQSMRAVNIRIDNDGKIAALHESKGKIATAVSNSVVNNELWNHFAMVKTSDSVFIYVNGNKENSIFINESIRDQSRFLIDIGSQRDLNENFQGSMDDFSIFRRALSVNEINDISEQKLSGTENNLILYLDFDEFTEGKYVVDKSPTGNTGLLPINYTRTFFNAITTCIDSPTLTPSNSTCGGVLKFDGIDDHVVTTIPGNHLYDRDFTIEAWVYLNEYNNTLSVITSTRKENEGILFYVGEESLNENKGRLCFQVGGQGMMSRDHFGNQVLETKKWYHVAVVYDYVGKAYNVFENKVKISLMSDNKTDLAKQIV
jgi:hypothetical protein